MVKFIIDWKRKIPGRCETGYNNRLRGISFDSLHKAQLACLDIENCGKIYRTPLSKTDPFGRTSYVLCDTESKETFPKYSARDNLYYRTLEGLYKKPGNILEVTNCSVGLNQIYNHYISFYIFPFIIFFHICPHNTPTEN